MSDAVSDADEMGREAIAIIGFAGRFPGADDCQTFWRNLLQQKETVTRFSREQLIEAGIPPQHVDHPNYVPANHCLGAVDRFDAEYFDIAAHEAEILDPQQRIFLEVAHAALEHAGYGPGQQPLPVGVFAGAGLNTYLLENLAGRYRASSSVDHYHLMITNDSGYLATRTAFKLDLTGPTISVNTACSTSLVAVHLACESLLDGECDMALAGGVAVRARQTAGYMYQEGMIFSPDGTCRAFDRNARGTLLGDGAGAVILKCLSDAIADGDTVHAIIRGSAVNNDGAAKMSYTAPSATGQAAVIADAHRVAEVDPETISYVEAHGTGTFIGDPIEIAGLTTAFREQTDRTGFCAIGSVKTNIGHLDVAAGMAGLIKAVHMLEHRQLVPSLHFEAVNPEIGFDRTPFYVQQAVEPWTSPDGPRRAGVSAFGIGGTNAHVVLEEAPPTEATTEAGPELLLISGATAAARDEASARLARFIRRNKGLALADAAHTLARGRRAHPFRRFVLARNARKAALALALGDPKLVDERDGVGAGDVHVVVTGHPDLLDGVSALGARSPAFAEGLEQCVAAAGALGTPLRTALHAPSIEIAALDPVLARTVCFGLAYAEAQMWVDWGLAPERLIGVGAGRAAAAAVRAECTLAQALLAVHDPDDGLSIAMDTLAAGSDPVLPVGVLPSALRDALGDRVLDATEGAASALEGVLSRLGRVWLAGVDVDWARVYASRAVRRVPLPTYPFQRKRFWIEPDQTHGAADAAAAGTSALLTALREAAPRARKGIVLEHLEGRLRALLGDGAGPITPDTRFLETGALDSLMLVEYVADLSMKLEASLHTSAFVEHPTLDAFAEHILRTVELAPAPQAPSDDRGTERRERRASLALRRRSARERNR